MMPGDMTGKRRRWARNRIRTTWPVEIPVWWKPEAMDTISRARTRSRAGLWHLGVDGRKGRTPSPGMGSGEGLFTLLGGAFSYRCRSLVRKILGIGSGCETWNSNAHEISPPLEKRRTKPVPERERGMGLRSETEQGRCIWEERWGREAGQGWGLIRVGV